MGQFDTAVIALLGVAFAVFALISRGLRGSVARAMGAHCCTSCGKLDRSEWVPDARMGGSSAIGPCSSPCEQLIRDRDPMRANDPHAVGSTH